MRFDLSFLERGYHANLLRIRASNLRGLVEDRSKAALRQELESEAAWCEEQARKLDDAEESIVASDREPIKVDSRRDIDSVDGPKSNGGV